MNSPSEDAFGALLDTFYFGALDERDKGDKFERLMRSYFMTDPAWASQFSQVWLWRDYPDRGVRTDTGIDLVAQEAGTGDRAAIQCKFYDPEHVIAKKDIDSFIAASATKEFSRRLFVSTSLKPWGSNAEAQVEALEPPMTRVSLGDLADAPIDWSQFSLDTPDHMVRTDEVKAPRAHQRDAMDKVAKGFTEHDRGKMIMACGTGKTYTALQIAEQQTPANGTVLFLVPSISLLSQTLTAWKRDAADDFYALAVCSDVKVGKNTADDISTTDLIIPATTDARRLNAQARRVSGGRTVVFSTYQSIDVIADAQAAGFPEFDLIVCDEAHRTTGATLAGTDESAFVRVHDNTVIRGSKRLYMTATPRVFDEASKRKADENSIVVASMDDESLYGPVFYRLGFGEAVERGLLTDYKVLVLAVDEASINSQFQQLLRDEDGELSIDDVARIVGCWKGLSTRGSQPVGDTGSGVSRPGPVAPMSRAVAFAANIRESKRTAGMFDRVSAKLTETNPTDLLCQAEHVDGTMNVMERNSRLRWLEAEPPEGQCRILTNARCLSEGVDVPDLDAVLFLNPRNSQVDVVQSVGRVMRKAKGKDYGYIILPVGILAGERPEQALKDNKKYKVIWSVLNALRSHDDRFEAMVNKIDLNQNRDTLLEVQAVVADDDGTIVLPANEQLALDLEFPGLNEWREAIYAKIVDKVGDREYWETWSKTIADVATRHTQRLTSLITDNPDQQVDESFDTFLAALRANLNDGISRADAISMLSQHLITKPVFDALFAGYDFANHNPVSQVMQAMIDSLDGNNLGAETSELEGFYQSVSRRAEGIDNPEGKQRIITELYENFFSKAFPEQADALGIVYTPVEIVDYILRAVDHLSREHFGAGITDEGVHVLDPFTGTGTFLVRLLETGIISPHDLARKYATELHANEIMLLAYYIAAVNIEATYHGLHGGDYQPFEGIVLADTFQMTESGDTLDTTLFTNNNARAQKQLDTDIRIIVANPPYSAGQTSANDNNANQGYPTLDGRIRESYAKRSSASLGRKLYDSYIRAIRWGTDRIGNQGILAYVTNGGYVDSNSADGLRKTLTQDYDHLYIYNLRGNSRTAGDIAKREGGNVFNVRVGVAIMVLVKDPKHTGDCILHYGDIGDYLTRENKLVILDHGTIENTNWETVTPNLKGEWINQSSDIFDTYPPLGDKKRTAGSDPIFTTYTLGLATNRDAWVYNYSQVALQDNVNVTISTYGDAQFDYDIERPSKPTENDVAKWLKGQPEYSDPAQISWSAGLRQSLARGVDLEQYSGEWRTSVYRPFCKQNVYFDRILNERTSQLPSMFPTSDHNNYGFYLHGVNPSQPFCLLATNLIPCLDLFGKGGQFFSRYRYEKIDEDGTLNLDSSHDDELVDGYRRVDNISDEALTRYSNVFGDQVSKDEIFASVYALLHAPQYRETFAADLKRQLPRIPVPDTREDFEAFATAGQQLLDLHIGYENADPYPLREEHSTADEASPDYYHVSKMRYTGNTRKPDRSTIVYNSNVTLLEIPDEAHDYMLGSRSALDWIIDRYQITTDKASGIVNDPNDWAKEHGEPRYIVDLVKRIVTVSVETMRVVNSLPQFTNDQ